MVCFETTKATTDIFSSCFHRCFEQFPAIILSARSMTNMKLFLGLLLFFTIASFAKGEATYSLGDIDQPPGTAVSSPQRCGIKI
jgi:hypothetical protein